MSKRQRFAVAGIVVLFTLAGLVVVPSFIGNKTSSSVCIAAGNPKPSYKIEWIQEGQLARIIGLNSTWTPGGYALALRDGLTEIAKDYTIVSLIPISYEIGYGSATGELYVFVEPKK